MPPVDPSQVPSGSTRRTPVAFLALAAILLLLRIATGIYEAREGRPAPEVDGSVQIHR
jgi:hypothetical protein